eukprot:g9793.t1
MPEIPISPIPETALETREADEIERNLIEQEKLLRERRLKKDVIEKFAILCTYAALRVVFEKVIFDEFWD